MSDARQLLLQHAYSTEDTGIPLVSGVPIELYRAALDEIRELRKPALESVEPSSAREIVLLLMAYPKDKCNNDAWASKLCADLFARGDLPKSWHGHGDEYRSKDITCAT